ncbi:hypothetical protein DVA67_000080 [Solirubrobacter sp. CPCC 204708]|uniref:CAP domain-containing protein n=1 Tax=Solirubrobacter deserti TaxID=2282478 RepID=A0ABT4RSI7_9ACTN|nr:CAP domain-containing protein [Solirubrobacter deserti]MBE2314354.1 hypothetical protein [Solirubrobacter deserti]MDA0141452.1 CAP domain-containing protein [Solirubrobacter deserti]
MSLLLRAALLAAAMLVVVPAAQAHACSGADSSAGSAATRASAVRCLVGQVRAQAGRAPLRATASLGRSAQLKASRIASCEQFSHTPCGTAFEAPMRAVGYARGCFTVAENLAYVERGATPRDVLQAWLDSPDHRATLLSGRYRDTGVARRVASLPGADRVELWVQHFGKRC